MPDTHIVKQLARGTTAVLDDYTGPAGELLMDTTTKELVLQDGTTQGGIRVGSGATYTAAAPLSIDSNNEISVADATTSAKGVVQVGDNVTVSSGAISVKPWAVHAASHNDVDPTDLQEGCIVDTDEPVGSSADVVLAEVEQTLTDDATKVPSSAAVYSAIQGGGGDIWTDPRPIVNAWGDLVVGSVLEGLSLKELMEIYFYGYVNPSFTSFTSNMATTIGIHETEPQNPTVTWVIDAPSKVKENSISVIDHTGATVASELAVDASPIVIPHAAWAMTEVGTATWTVKGIAKITNTEFSKTLPIYYRYRVYYGKSESLSLSALSTKLVNDVTTAKYNDTTNSGYFWVISPVNCSTMYYATSSYGTYSSIESIKSSFSQTMPDGSSMTWYALRSKAKPPSTYYFKVGS